MVLRRIPGTDLSYHLIEFDKRGIELRDEDGQLGSDSAIKALAESASVTDVFIVSHGWLGNYEDAIAQYDSWLGKSPSTTDDDFRPFVIGLHWPSKAWSDRPIEGAPSGLLGESGASIVGSMSVAEAVHEFAGNLAESESALAALETIVTYAASIAPDIEVSDSDTLDEDVAHAYRVLAEEVTVAGGSSDDLLLGGGWDPEPAFAEAAQAGGETEDGLLGDGLWSSLREAVLSPLRQLTFWSMKDRARKVGESGVRRLIRDFQRANGEVRVHMAGHSFGTIVVSAAVRGPGERPEPPARPVGSMLLVQGAVSLWAFAATIPDSVGGGRGYFADLARREFISGPIIATRSTWDYAVGRYYPLAVRAASQYLLGDLPKYGAIGTHGIQGADAEELPPLAEGVPTRDAFSAKQIYNIDASTLIASRRGLEGAHSDIAHPELILLAWNAARSRANPRL